MSSIAEEIEALRSASVAELVERYAEVYGRPPRVKHREWLWKRIAWRLQEQRHGGLSEVAKRKLEELIDQIDLPLEDRSRSVSGKLMAPSRGDPPVGTVLVREWRGDEIRVTVVDGGFECDGEVYRSLSAAARAVTGTRWNGRLFFGLTTRGKKA